LEERYSFFEVFVIYKKARMIEQVKIMNPERRRSYEG